MPLDNDFLEFLDDSGIDEKYFMKKDLLVHSILEPVFELKNQKHTFWLFGGRTTRELLKEYQQSDINRVDAIYNRMLLRDRLAFLVRYISEKDTQMVMNAGYTPDAVFTAFKDDLLKAGPMVAATLEVVDAEQWKQSELN